MSALDRLLGRPEFREISDFDIVIRSDPDVSIDRMADDVLRLWDAVDTTTVYRYFSREVSRHRTALEALLAHPRGVDAPEPRSDYLTPPSIETLVQVVQAATNRAIEIRGSRVPDNTVAAVLEVYASGLAVITYNADLDPAWRRLVVATELAHLLLDTSEVRAGNLDKVLGLLSALGASDGLRSSPAWQEWAYRHSLDELVALDLLVPPTTRTASWRMLDEGRATAEELEVLVGLPAEFLNRAHLMDRARQGHADWSSAAKFLRETLEAANNRNAAHPNPDNQWEEHLGDALLAKGGGAVSAAELAAMSGRSLAEVLTDIATGRLLGVRRGEEWFLPRDQVDPTGRPLPGLQETLEIYGPRHPLTVLQFLVTPDTALAGRSPLTALKQGGDGPAKVLRAAAAHQGDGFA